MILSSHYCIYLIVVFFIQKHLYFLVYDGFEDYGQLTLDLLIKIIIFRDTINYRGNIG